jgi:hypothetical protein
MRERTKHPHYEYLRHRIITGSIGAELWSSICWMLLAVFFLNYPPPPIGIVLTALRGDHAQLYLVLVFLITLFHAIEMANQPDRRSIATRKIACALEAAAWTEISGNLVVQHQPGSVVLLAPLIVLLFVAILRRSYYTWDILA